MKLRKRVVAAACIVGLALGGIVSSAPSASAATSGVDMNAACATQYGSGWVAYIQDYNALGWRCGFRPYPNVLQKAGKQISVWAECQRTHGSRAGAYTHRVTDPYSWYCSW